MARKPKFGDIVHIRATVTEVTPNENEGVRVSLTCPGIIWVTAKEIVHVEPAPLKVGDSVLSDCHKGMGTLLAIDGGFAWVRWSTGPTTVSVTILKRADEPRPLKVGDKVRHRDGFCGKIVRFRDGDMAVVSVPRTGCDYEERTVYLTSLERVD